MAGTLILLLAVLAAIVVVTAFGTYWMTTRFGVLGGVAFTLLLMFVWEVAFSALT